jgi:hypothetical protein
MKPVGLAGSGGSTPLRLRVAGNPDAAFREALRDEPRHADRWYKVGRFVYGRLRTRPHSVGASTRAIQDCTLRLFRDIGIRTAAPSGSSATPERSTSSSEFFDGAKEIGEADVDDTVIDGGLGLIRAMWDAGVAHRDIKPASISSATASADHRRCVPKFVRRRGVKPSTWRT